MTEISTKQENGREYEVREILYKKLDTDMNYRHEYVWYLVVIHAFLQASWLCGIYTALFHAKLATLLWASTIGFGAGQTISIGTHRAYCHKSYKPTVTLQIIYLFFHTIAGQNSMFTWARDHKLHHKYSDTDADPHNAKRGFFFSHMGWLLVKKHPLVKEKQRQLDISDLKADKLLMFHHKYFAYLYVPIGFLFPISVPMYFWNETFWCSFFVAYSLQYVTNLHLTWTINSFSHLWGTRPYDKRIQAVRSKFAWIVTAGEGPHNYHHAFPWDSRLCEQGKFPGLSTGLLYFLAYIGLAYDFKVANPDIVHKHMKRHGEQSTENSFVLDYVNGLK